MLVDVCSSYALKDLSINLRVAAGFSHVFWWQGCSSVCVWLTEFSFVLTSIEI